MSGATLSDPFPPADYVRWRHDPHDVVAWRPVADAAREALESAPSLNAWATERSERTIAAGRGELHVAPLGPVRAAVRHYRRGGWMAPLLGDRYLDRPPRAFAELSTSEALRAAGVATPRVLVAAVTDAGIGYRADLATRWLEGGHDLVGLLRPGAYPPETRARALGVAGREVGRAHAAGLDHPDLNVANLFLHHDGSAWSAALLDLDRARVRAPEPARSERNLARLRRSIDKAKRAGRISWTEADESAFRAGWTRGKETA